MNPERYQKICDIFAEASELPREQRAEFLDEQCAGDPELRGEVESLLASDESSGDFIKAPALEVAADLLAADERLNTKTGLKIEQYKITSLLGTGGMGEVWLAEDSRLKRQVALKLLSSVHTPDFLMRFEQEAYAASALNHPNIITIFDVGQSEGWQFIATEYISGKTLRQLLNEKSLTVSQSVEIATQVCAALVAAHEAGIVHRDIKPENIMVRADGIVKVLDFGLARFSTAATHPDAKFITKPGMIMGTVTYMSPEQARALPVDERTDVFSLGVILYEMLMGKQPFEGVNDVEVLAAILERAPQPLSYNLPDSLSEVVAKALKKNPDERLSAAQMLDELRAVKRNLEFSTDADYQHKTGNLNNAQTDFRQAVTANNERPAKLKETAAASPPDFKRAFYTKFVALGGVLLAAALGFALYQVWVRTHTPAVLSDADKLLIGAFENKTGDEELENLFRQPLALGLAQSPFISLVSDGQIRQTLKAMEKSPTEPLTYAVAKEICQRRNVKAFLTGRIENYGVKYLITLEAFDTQTGKSVAREEAESANKETILDSLDEATTEMREKLGESLASIKRFDTPLKTSTTSSLEALRMYSAATKSLTDGKTEDGISQLKQAIGLDPGYAGAYASLAAAYNNTGQMTEAKKNAAEAFKLRERMTEREYQKISSFYYALVTGEIDKDIENLEGAKQAYPRDNIIPINLGASYVELGKFAKAEENARLSINLDPTVFFAYSNLGNYLKLQSRFEESRAVYQDALSRNFKSEQINTGLFTDAFALGDEAEMQKNLKILQDDEEERIQAKALLLQGNVAIFSGKARDYEKVMSQSVSMTEKEMPDIAADYAVQMAVNFAALNKCSDAQSWANRALKLDREPRTLIDATFTSALCGGQTDPLINELKEKFSTYTVVKSLWLPIIRAALEIKESPERAIETLEINRQFEGATYFWDNYLRGKAYLQINKPDLAIGEFQKILQNRGWGVHSPLYALAHLELSKAYAMQNDKENEKKYSEQFTALWKNADADLPVMKESMAKK